jgi:hypothetical protein
MAKMGFPEPSVGPRFNVARSIQSLHHYHVDAYSCGRRSITGGADEPLLIGNSSHEARRQPGVSERTLGA